MEIFLPIADQPANVLILLALGIVVGFMGAMFGVGGGFLMTPLLVFLGIGPGVAVASSANYIAASSFSGALSYWRRRMVDLKLSAALFAGAVLGTAVASGCFKNFASWDSSISSSASRTCCCC